MSSLGQFMPLALDVAFAALAHGDVPVGAVVVGPDGRVLSQRHNERELTKDPTGHAEILALREAALTLGTWRLDGCALIVTLEPCPMCAGAAMASRISTVVFGAADPKAGALGSLYNLAEDPRLNHRIEVIHGVMAEECGAILRNFFAGRRDGLQVGPLD
jgi:tRNA(adenine34) deaminase